MYTLVRVRPKGERKYIWTGYIYDISATGMRFELDTALEPGTNVELHAMLPGPYQTTINASGTVVRIHDDENEQGPIRMGLVFEKFSKQVDRRRLTYYLEQFGLRAA